MDNVTRLTAIEKGREWTVRIAWPNGTTHHFGAFRSKNEADAWIAEHRWMSVPKFEMRDIDRRRRPRQASLDRPPEET